MRRAEFTANPNTNPDIACLSPSVTAVDTATKVHETQKTAFVLETAYDDLRRLARAKVARAGFKETLTPTELVHETYLRLAASRSSHFEERRHFFFTADRAMRDILVEKTRQQTSLKRGFGIHRVELDEVQVGTTWWCDQGVDLDRALAKLGRKRPQLAQVVRLSFFDGLTHPEISRRLGISRATVERRWADARAWLRRELSGDRES